MIDEAFNTPKPKVALENDTAVLVLGIISLVICGPGLVTGIVAIVLSNQALRSYNANPELYKEASYKNVKAGRICAIVSLCLYGIIALIYAGLFGTMILSAGNVDSWAY